MFSHVSVRCPKRTTHVDSGRQQSYPQLTINSSSTASRDCLTLCMGMYAKKTLVDCLLRQISCSFVYCWLCCSYPLHTHYRRISSNHAKIFRGDHAHLVSDYFYDVHFHVLTLLLSMFPQQERIGNQQEHVSGGVCLCYAIYSHFKTLHVYVV